MPTYAQIKNPAIPLLGCPSAGSNFSRAIQAAAIIILNGNFSPAINQFNNGMWRNLSGDVNGRTNIIGNTANSRTIAAAAAWITDF